MGETNSELPWIAFSEHKVLWVSQREKLGACWILCYPPGDRKAPSYAVRKTVDLFSVWNFPKYLMDGASVGNLKYHFLTPLKRTSLFQVNPTFTGSLCHLVSQSPIKIQVLFLFLFYYYFFFCLLFVFFFKDFYTILKNHKIKQGSVNIYLRSLTESLHPQPWRPLTPCSPLLSLQLAEGPLEMTQALVFKIKLVLPNPGPWIYPNCRNMLWPPVHQNTSHSDQQQL